MVPSQVPRGTGAERCHCHFRALASQTTTAIITRIGPFFYHPFSPDGQITGQNQVQQPLHHQVLLEMKTLSLHLQLVESGSAF